jgi:ligand-binding sensor domain-containing protein
MRRILYSFVLSLLFSPVFAQNPFSKFKLEHWDTKKGLSNDLLLFLYQSKEGFLWMGSYAGLTRFDGINFTTFNTQNLPLLSTNNVNEIAESYDSTLWIATQNSGLLSYKRGKFEQYLKDYNPERIISLAGKQLLISSGNRGSMVLFDIKTKQYQELDSATYLLLLKTKKIILPKKTDKLGNQWVTWNRRQVLRLKDGKSFPLTAQEGLLSDAVYYNSFVDSQGRVWLPSSKGL